MNGVDEWGSGYVYQNPPPARTPLWDRIRALETRLEALQVTRLNLLGILQAVAKMVSVLGERKKWA